MAGGLLALTGFAYGVAAFWAVAAFYDLRRQQWAWWSAGVGWLAQTGWLAWSAYTLGGAAWFSLDRWLGLVDWISVGAFLGVSRQRGWETALGFLLPVIFALWWVGILLSPVQSRPDVLGALLWIHVGLAALAYVALLLSALVATMYTEKERELRRRHVRLFYYRLPDLEAMDRLSARLVAVGVLLLGVAIVTGALWAKVVAGRYWNWSPKEVWTAASWATYAAYLVARWRWGWRGHASAVWAMAAFLLVVVNLFVINAVFPGFHAVTY
ncbi:MAG: cytochrome c biogenesis protein [Firmicutes bacterium]|nr:cytochrome c biogenesis protein CcsA [Alicyclobacillaceae bacterium]MCL6497596.1 cytochrome c biogenesis protein [Bacillota bacterium]